MAAAVALIAYCAPDDADQGLSLKFFYFHVPMALRAYACVLLVELAGKRIDLRLREFKGVARVTAAEKSNVPRKNLREAQQLLARVNADVQKAGAAMKAEDYLAAQPALDGIKERIQQVSTLLDQRTASQAPRVHD